ncbi:histidine phosphatase family protein [Alicyclobacillus fodiniaquatilis]|uniref:Histidine phosphatase family protein n=1 Tax=Alicyclobacillus fodiniaquatilis TaxID=1661150 RepID=A0ABW4JLG4_9BACL
MQTNLYFVRHAHSTYTPDEFGRPLSAQGIADANRVTELLLREDIDVVVSSPYKRAVQTVQGIADFLGNEILIEMDLRERRIATNDVDDFAQAMKQLWTNPFFSFAGGESNHAAQHRGVSATRNILKKYQGDNVVIGTHGNLMVLIMNHFRGTYDFAFWQQLTMPDIYKLSFCGHHFVDAKRIWGKL